MDNAALEVTTFFLKIFHGNWSINHFSVTNSNSMMFLIDVTWIFYNLDLHISFIMLAMLYIASLAVSLVQYYTPNI